MNKVDHRLGSNKLCHVTSKKPQLLGCLKSV